MSKNKIFLHGFVGKDAELKTTQQGNPMARFSLATTETWKNQAGEKQSKTEWHNIVVWGKRAETVAKLVKKSQELLIEGKLEYNTTDKDGVKKTYAFIKLIDFDFCGKKSGSNQSETPDPEYSGPDYDGSNDGGLDSESNRTPNSSATPPDDDIPF